MIFARGHRRVRARIATPGRALREKLCASWTDQLNEDASLDRPDLEVEVSEEVHPEQPVDAFMIEIEHLERSAKFGVDTPSAKNSATRSQ